MSTIKKKVRIVDWFTPIQKKAKTLDVCFSTPQPSINPSPEEAEIGTGMTILMIKKKKMTLMLAPFRMIRD